MIRRSLGEIDRQKLKSIGDLLRRGGRLLGEPCPRCGGVLVQHRGETFCISCDDVSQIEKSRVASPTDVASRLKRLASAKIEETAKRLEDEEDVERQTRLADLLLRYIDILDRVARYEKRSGSKENRGDR